MTGGEPRTQALNASTDADARYNAALLDGSLRALWERAQTDVGQTYVSRPDLDADPECPGIAADGFCDCDNAYHERPDPVARVAAARPAADAIAPLTEDVLGPILERLFGITFGEGQAAARALIREIAESGS